MSHSWTDNDSVCALARVADSLASLADLIPSRVGIEAPPCTTTAELPIQGLPAHIRFARIWTDRQAEFLARREVRGCPLCGGREATTSEFGLDAHGVEGLHEAVRFCHERRRGLRVTHAHAEELSSATVGDQCDLVTMWETLEHTLDPVAALRAAWRALKPGGLLALSVPNARNVQCSVLRDFCFFA